MIQGAFLLARKHKPSTKQSIFETSDLVCLKTKTQLGRTTCSCQSLATRYCKISAPTCGSQEFGNRSITKENLFLGQQPTRLVVDLVENDAYNGVITKFPFHFKHNNINFMTIYRDGVQIPSKPLQPAFVNDRFIRSYLCLFTQTGQYYHDTGNGISREQYKDGYALFAFDLMPQIDLNKVGFELIKHGNICTEIHFANATARTLLWLCWPKTTTYWKSIKTGTLLLTTRHEHAAN